MRIGVIGSRAFNDVELLNRELDKYLDKVRVIVS